MSTGERLYCRQEFLPVLHAGVAVVQPDLSHAGGITEPEGPEVVVAHLRGEGLGDLHGAHVRAVLEHAGEGEAERKSREESRPLSALPSCPTSSCPAPLVRCTPSA